MADFLFGDSSPIIVAAVVVVVFLFFWKRPSRIISVEDSLKSLGDEYKVFRDILVTLKSGMYKIGYLVVSRYGLFLIDERSESGTVQVSIDQREWLVTSPGTKEYIYNPVWRAREAVNKLNDQGDAIPILSLIIFIQAKLKNNFSKDVISLGDLKTRIKKEAKVLLDDGQVQIILERLEKRNK
jgi:hypothetical protein